MNDIDSEMGDRHATPPSQESPNVAIPILWNNDAQLDISPLYHKTIQHAIHIY